MDYQEHRSCPIVQEPSGGLYQQDKGIYLNELQEIGFILKVIFVAIVTNATTSKALFLIDKTFVEISTMFLCGDAKIKISMGFQSCGDNYLEEQIERMKLFTKRTCSDVLRMHHTIGNVQNGAPHNFTLIYSHEQSDILWETTM